MEFSVVIPAYNAAHTIESCIKSLQNQIELPGPYEIIVVDNGSQDDTAQVAARAGARVVTETKRGAAAARNRGIREARGAIICLTDADCEPLEDWICAISQKLRANPEVIGTKGVYLTRQQAAVARFVQLEYEDKYDLLPHDQPIDFIDTYSAAYRRDVLLANDGFDEEMTYLEDQELSFRLHARGYKMMFEPSAVVYHLHSATLPAYLRKKFTIAYWKAQVVRRFPNRGSKDSHTPQVMKIQMGLILLLAGAIVGALGLPLINRIFPSPIWRRFLLLIPLILLSFLGTTIPFLRKAWPKDRMIALLAPAILFGRASAQTAGYIWGVLRPAAAVSRQDMTTISGLSYRLKRGLDIAVALIGLLITGLLIPLVALGQLLFTPGPLFESEQWVGQEGGLFTRHSFRTASAKEGKRSPSRFGQVLERWGIDRLPQFWNVLRGEMSLIGPQAAKPEEVDRYSDHQRLRLAVKPGMTGPIQISQQPDLSIGERVELELDYIHRYRLRRDIEILLKTIPVVLGGQKAK